VLDLTLSAKCLFVRPHCLKYILSIKSYVVSLAYFVSLLAFDVSMPDEVMVVMTVAEASEFLESLYERLSRETN